MKETKRLLRTLPATRYKPFIDASIGVVRIACLWSEEQACALDGLLQTPVIKYLEPILWDVGLGLVFDRLMLQIQVFLL